MERKTFVLFKKRSKVSTLEFHISEEQLWYFYDRNPVSPETTQILGEKINRAPPGVDLGLSGS